MATSLLSSESEKFFIIGIGASAGGVQALESFFHSLPDNPNAAFVVVQHLSPNHRSMMTEILGSSGESMLNLDPNAST